MQGEECGRGSKAKAGALPVNRRGQGKSKPLTTNPKCRKKGQGQGQNQRKEPKYEERIIEVRRVTKVIQGGRSVSFRACMCIGNRQGTVGVGVDKAKEVSEAIEKARNKAIKTAISVPLTRNSSVPHEARVKGGGGTEIDIYPAGIGTGVNAGGACRPVMELAGVQNIFVKQRRSRNYINNAMAVVQGLERMQSARDTCRLRGFSSIKELFSAKDDPAVTNV